MTQPTPPDSERESGHNFLLVKRGLYYRPDNQGYTGIKDLAGRYPQSDANEDCGIKAIHEDDALPFSAACWPDLAQAHLEGQLTTLRQRADAMEEALKDTIEFAEARLTDGKEMGASIWRIALEDIIRDAKAALEQST